MILYNKKKPYEKFKDPKEKDGYKTYGFENLKDFLDYYYVIPKCRNFSINELNWIDANRVYFICDEEVKGQPFFNRKVKKKRFNKEQIEQIKREHFEEGLSYRKLSSKYKCSKSTLYEIFKDKY